jgi:L-seryl-tRNA(Ser) seleniumtransferase
LAIFCFFSAEARTIENVADRNLLRELPSVHELFENLAPRLARFPRALVLSEIPRAIDERRREAQAGVAGSGALESRIERSLAQIEQASLKRVINATGVVLHTNLGPGTAGGHFDSGRLFEPGIRFLHGTPRQTGRACRRLVLAPFGTPAVTVNNNAAAIYLALHELAADGEVIVSPGELIEIGDGFRIPEIMRHSTAILREMGTTRLRMGKRAELRREMRGALIPLSQPQQCQSA